ncbi:hypothetical protein ONZ43_g4185 [Nemania bipapillata]|uniref:Uncharacterized protein n=1 Tax=Nemania bipapillata TaxID=110536 RepID=A0ACC2IQY5_9PEZI|nr:hypothetical protein ONZ43_g4185 [Nemania bipapillata]
MASEYVFTPDYVDNNRINLQHYLWCKIFGYRIHPHFSVEDTDLRIADMGTGTNVWLIGLAARLPASVQLEGLDISFDATAPKPMLPSNIVLQQWNVKDAVPTILLGRYDMLHIRHFIANSKTVVHQELLQATLSQDRRLAPTWVPRLPDLFSVSGLVAVEHEAREALPHLAMALHECNMSLHELIARQVGNTEFLVRV